VAITRVRDSFMHTACVWSEKLPFAGYSVEKDPEALRPLAWRRDEALERPRFKLLRRAGGRKGPSEAARPQWPRFKQSGEYRARTGDLLVANQALSQLS
jgi:hypothetical protein